MLQKVTCGPMFAGKTTRLLKDYRKYGGIVIRSNFDNRYSETEVVTHNKESIPAFGASSLDGLIKLIEPHEYVYIDELHFFVAPLFEGDLMSLIQDSAKKFFCYGLDYDWQGKAFPICEQAKSITVRLKELKGTCSCCGEPSTMTYMHREENKKDGNLVLGHNDIYEPRCYTCWEAGMQERCVA